MFFYSIARSIYIIDKILERIDLLFQKSP